VNLTLDIGNTAVKWATFDGKELKDCGYGMSDELMAKADYTLACASGELPEGVSVQRLTADMPLPIKLDYKTPETLGADRIADACGAAGLHPGEPCLVIDAGTCITVDFIDAKGVYHGGAIMPGLKMNLQALHTFTAKLPLIDLEGVEKAPVLGRSTEESILAGTVGATLLSLAGYVALYKEKAPNLRVLLTGGDAKYLLASGTNNGWEHVQNLTLIGLNEIMIYNEK
jgi:type III pantothenate kinase